MGHIYQKKMPIIKNSHLPMIIVNTIPHKKQRYDTVGDWPSPVSGIQHFFISSMKKRAYEVAVFTHELIEEEWCTENNITPQIVDDWDMLYTGKYTDDPGADPKCPYHKGHMLGLKAERFVIEKVFNLSWKEYISCDLG